MSHRTILAAVASLSICMLGGTANAKDTDKGKMSMGKLVLVCNDKDGTFWKSADGANYGCGYKGGGGITCDKDTGCLESGGNLDPGQEERRSEPWPWAGLLGLIGLLGLTGRKRKDSDPVR